VLAQQIGQAKQAGIAVGKNGGIELEIDFLPVVCVLGALSPWANKPVAMNPSAPIAASVFICFLSPQREPFVPLVLLALGIRLVLVSSVTRSTPPAGKPVVGSETRQ
jgi:hypothetical protein